MRKRTIISTPFPTVEEAAADLGVSRVRATVIKRMMDRITASTDNIYQLTSRKRAKFKKRRLTVKEKRELAGKS